jgi:hypothetical protein
MEIVRLTQPSLEDFQRASEVCEQRWPYLSGLNRPDRFAVFAQLGVELVLVREQNRIDGVCFVLPANVEAVDGWIPCVWLFQLAMRRGKENLSTFLILRIMKAYPVVLTIGVTREAERLYRVLKWNCYPSVWRAAHPIDLCRLAEDYRDRLRPWQQRLLAAGGVFYNFAARIVEFLLAGSASLPDPTALPAGPLQDKLRAIATYLPLFAAGRADGRVQTVALYGIGRIVQDEAKGWRALRSHTRLWRQLRSRDVKLCEMLVASEQAKTRARWLGYLSMPMPIWYWDPAQSLAQHLEPFVGTGLSFLHTDKVL